jgi:hypothetical protein
MRMWLAPMGSHLYSLARLKPSERIWGRAVIAPQSPQITLQVSASDSQTIPR